MPDRRKHRGRNPEDSDLFSDDHLASLGRAVRDFSWLLSRGYADRSSLKLVGDRYALTARQRTAVRRSTCSADSLERRRGIMVRPADVGEVGVGVDGYNLLITVESGLGGGIVLIGQDGAYRDLASIHGTYRKVEETLPALRLIVDHLARLPVPRIDWYLDRPVSNSGRLKALLADMLESRPNTGGPVWNIELVDSPDAVLRAYDGVVVTSDSAILDNCRAWMNLAAEVIQRDIPSAWKVELGERRSDGAT